MKIKLDENLPARLVPILHQHGHIEYEGFWLNYGGLATVGNGGF